MPRTGSSAHGHDKDFGHATWSVGSGELRQPGTEADGKPVTESNLSLRVPARIPADLYFRKRPSIEGYCRTDRGDRRVVTVAHTVQRTAPDGATAESEVSAAL